jgi:hypothetical protein
MPATIRFRDGSESQDYCEVVVTGWAGLAGSGSGIHITEECPACGRKKYSALMDPSQLIKWSQWTGDDFFIVWPIPLFILITERVAEYLKTSKAKSYSLTSAQKIQGQGFTPGWLSELMPEDLAVKYGCPLGIE